MSATVFYDNVNEIALISNTFTGSGGAAADPTTVSCIITDPAGVIITHTFAGAAPADVIKTGTGKYTLSVPCSPSVAGIDGLWSFVWVGTGAVSDAQPGTWRVLPQAVGTFYCGLEELKSRLGITDTSDDYEAQIAIQAASSWINRYCGTHFGRITETRTFVPHDLIELDIDPLVTVTALSIDRDGDGIFEESWVQGTDYQLKLGRDSYNVNADGIARPYKKVQVTQSGRLFPFIYPFAHFDRVQIAGTWGWPAVPPPVAQAALMLSAEWFKSKDAPFGVAGVSDFGVVRIQSNPWLSDMLSRFSNRRRSVGV